MRLRHKCIWLVYVLILIIFLGNQAYNFISPNGNVYLYFTILKAFDSHFLTAYYFYWAQIIFNGLHLIPLLLYIFKIRLGKQKTWQMLLLLRLFFDLFGHAYEMATVTSLVYAGWIYVIIVVGQSVLTYIPSYLACFRYAFQQEQFLEKS